MKQISVRLKDGTTVIGDDFDYNSKTAGIAPDVIGIA